MEHLATLYYIHESDHEPAAPPQYVDRPDDIVGVIDHLVTGENWMYSAIQISHGQRPMRPIATGDLFPDHVFTVAVDVGTGETGALRFIDQEGGYVTQGQHTGREHPYHLAGEDLYFPDDVDIVIGTVKEAAREFLANGGRRPGCVEWRPEVPPRW